MVAATTLIDSAETAFERLFAQEYGRVASIAFRITRDAGEAEDVAQEVFVRFARLRREAADSARAWLYQAAVHTALNAVRTRRRRAQRELRVVRLQTPLEAGDADPARVVERRAQAAMVRAALLRVKPAEAEILALRYAGLSYREIAQIINVDIAQIGVRLARAERALKREIERETSR
jgi:RNA polymerase sigma-70 factor (ECF subfamily)